MRALRSIGRWLISYTPSDRRNLHRGTVKLAPRVNAARDLYRSRGWNASAPTPKSTPVPAKEGGFVCSRVGALIEGISASLRRFSPL